MNIDTIRIEKIDNGVIVEYWEKGEVRKKAFTDIKKLAEFIKQQIGMKSSTAK